MKPKTSFWCVWALAGVLLAGPARADGGEDWLAEAASEVAALDNAATKTAVDAETLVLPLAWGGAAAVGLTVRAATGSVSSEPSLDPSAETYDWETTPLLPGRYTLTLMAGGETYVANYEVTATAVAEWGTLTIDNGTTGESGATHLADATESLVLPGAWGEAVEGEITITVADGFVSSEQSLDSSAEAYDWDTLPLLPGAYDVTLKWNGKTYTTTYTVAALAEAELVGDAAVTLDNAKDANGVRRAGEASVAFNIAWPDMQGTPMLTCNKKSQPAVADADGMWTWQTNGLARGYYKFTHTVQGRTETALFHLASPFLWVYLEDYDENLSIPERWYRENVNETVPEDEYAVSASLLSNAANGHAYWQNYVMGWNPSDADARLSADIAVADLGEGRRKVTVKVLGANPPLDGKFGNLVLKYRLCASESLTGAFENVGESQEGTTFEEETTAARRFYRPAAALERK